MFALRPVYPLACLSCLSTCLRYTLTNHERIHSAGYTVMHSIQRRLLSTSHPTRSHRRPTLNATMKKFNLLVHPDLFVQHPECQKINQESLQALNSLLGTLKTKDRQEPYPPKQRLELVFYIKKRSGTSQHTFHKRSNAHIYCFADAMLAISCARSMLCAAPISCS